MRLNEVFDEFQELITIAQDMIVQSEPEINSLPIDQFLQLVLDIRNSERGEPNLADKNVVILEKDILQ